MAYLKGHLPQPLPIRQPTCHREFRQGTERLLVRLQLELQRLWRALGQSTPCLQHERM